MPLPRIRKWAGLGIMVGLGTTMGLLAVPVIAQTQDPQPTETPSSTSTTDSPRFICQIHNGQHTVMYFPESQPTQAYPWAVPQALGGGWTPDRRCNEISKRLEFYRPDGLVELRTGVENCYNTVCVTTEKDSRCRIVLTVPPGKDPVQTRDSIFQNLTIADSGQQTQGVATYTGTTGGSSTLDDLINLGNSTLGGGMSQARSSSINLRPFLDRADGGTGVRLTGGVSAGRGVRLNPGSFR